jgi:hypothetical protein
MGGSRDGEQTGGMAKKGQMAAGLMREQRGGVSGCKRAGILDVVDDGE